MNPEDVRLNSVNWEHGMLLTPEHFLREERYMDACLLWMLRYSMPGFGLVGGGPRQPEAERGAVRHDPVVAIDEDEQKLHISITQCRAITPAGCIVDIDPEHSIDRSFEKPELDGISEPRIYVVFDPLQKQVIDGPVDDFNPQMRTERRPAYAITLSVTADTAPYAIAVSRLRRQRYGAGYEKDSAYIPPCTTLVGFSELAAAWRKIVESTTFLTERYTELHRAMREFQVLFSERGIDTELDTQTINFVDRMVVALQNCVYELLDPVQPPQAFFGKLRRLFHSAAVYLDLAPSVQQYFNSLKDAGETQFIAMIDQQKKLLATTRTCAIHDDLAVDVRDTLGSLAALQALERALEGKYLDFHISPSLDAMNFVFDRGGRVLYRLAAKASHVQGVGDELSIYMAPLRLEGREKYRLILVGEQNAVFEPGTRITAEIRVNEGAGFQRPPVILACESKTLDQRNFEYDFDAPDVPTITDIRVSVEARFPIRTALLFIRHRFFAQQPQENVRGVEPLRSADARPPEPGRVPPEAPPYYREGIPAEARPGRLSPAPPAPWDKRPAEPPPGPQRSVRSPEGPAPPWEPGRGVQRSAPPPDRSPQPPRSPDRPANPNDAPPPRRRRLEP